MEGKVRDNRGGKQPRWNGTERNRTEPNGWPRGAKMRSGECVSFLRQESEDPKPKETTKRRGRAEKTTEKRGDGQQKEGEAPRRGGGLAG
ncbi:unnamed protein product [Calypogeia fissa]